MTNGQKRESLSLVHEWVGSGCASEVGMVLFSLQPASDTVGEELGGALEPGSPEGNTEGPGTASSEPPLPS